MMAPRVAWGTTPSRQAADLNVKILLRALAYDRNLKARAGTEVTLAVVYRKSIPSSVSAKDDLMAALEPLSKMTLAGLKVLVMGHDYQSPERLIEQVEQNGIDVLLLCPGVEAVLPAILTVSHSKKLPTLATDAALVQAGASIGVAERHNAPKLLINLTASKEEGMSLAADLMRIADVLR